MNQIPRLLGMKNYDPLIAAFAGFMVVYAYTKHSGVGISPDSVMYLSTARNLHAQSLFIDYDNKPMVMFPLFYPYLLSLLISITRLDPLVFAPWLNPLLFAIFIYISGRIMEGFTHHSRWYRQIVLFAIALSPCLLEIYSMLWSETVFLLLQLLFFVSLTNYLKTLTIKNLVYTALVASLACITRYAGVTLIATGGLMILLSFKTDLKKRIIHAFIFGAIASSLLLVNLVRNQLYSATLTGEREKSVTSIWDNLYNLGNVFCDWLPIPENKYYIAVFTAALLLLLFSAVFVRRLYRNIHVDTFENISTLFFVIYGMFMIVSATLSKYETFSSRLISPAFMPMIWGGSSMIMLYRDQWTAKKRLWVTVLILIFFAGFQVNQIKDDLANYEGIGDAGVPGYTEDSWNKDSEIVNFLRKHSNIFQSGYARYSNTDEAIYFYTGLSCHILPHQLSAKEKQQYYSSSQCYLIWFDDNSNDDLITLEQALQHQNMVLLYKFSNGKIYVTRQ